MSNQDSPESKKEAATESEPVRAAIGMHKWMRRTARKASASASNQPGNDAAQAAADALANVLDRTRLFD